MSRWFFSRAAITTQGRSQPELLRCLLGLPYAPAATDGAADGLKLRFCLTGMTCTIQSDCWNNDESHSGGASPLRAR